MRDWLLGADAEDRPRGTPRARRPLAPLRLRLRGGQDGDDDQIYCAGCCVFCFVAILSMSISSLAPNEYGILRNSITGALSGKDVYHGGILFTGPMMEFLKFPAAQITLEFSNRDPIFKPIEAWTGKDAEVKREDDLGSSGQPIEISCALQFRFIKENLKTVYTKFGGVEGALNRYRLFVRNAVSVASQKWPPTSFWEMRAAITAEMLGEINASLWHDGYVAAQGFEILDINFAAQFENMIIQNQVNEQRQTTNLYDQQVTQVVQGTEVLRQENLARIQNITAEAHAQARRLRAEATSYGFAVSQAKKAEKYSELQQAFGFDKKHMRQYYKIKAMEGQGDGSEVTVGVPGVVDRTPVQRQEL